MHASVLAWLPHALSGHEVADRRVLEVGSYDVNGSARPYIESLHPHSYMGVDQGSGPGVDRVLDCADLVDVFGPDSFDVVVSTEMLEHAPRWQQCVARMCEVLAPGGLLVLTTRSPGFPYHPFPVDCWRFPVESMRAIIKRTQFYDLLVIPDSDPAAPGVFAKAGKPLRWRAPWSPPHDPDTVFAGITVEAVITPC